MIEVCGIVVTQGNAGEKSVYVAKSHEADDSYAGVAVCSLLHGQQAFSSDQGDEKPCLTSIQEAIETIKWKN
jgi:hypothetical protein